MASRLTSRQANRPVNGQANRLVNGQANRLVNGLTNIKVDRPANTTIDRPAGTTIDRPAGTIANRPNNIDLNASCVNYNNISQGIIHITEDKLNVILLKYESKYKKFHSWTTPLGVFITCLIATITSNFKQTWGLSPDTWKAIFIIITGLSCIWLVCSGYKSIMIKNKIGIEKLIEEIKNTGVKK